MGIATKLIRGAARRAATRAMDRIGGKVVSRIADTSSDAPSAFHQPKRDLYRHLKDGGPVDTVEVGAGDPAPAGDPSTDRQGPDNGPSDPDGGA
ncbi:MAG: hypothetical protein D6798_16705 [Deltaproteobacteria bacterium]|nr:MAG: hypothetical protein D6798_16705 [Deltaproteobacteria bacterium]